MEQEQDDTADVMDDDPDTLEHVGAGDSDGGAGLTPVASPPSSPPPVTPAGQRGATGEPPAGLPTRRSTTSLLTLGTVVLVLVIVIVLVAVKVTGNSNTSTATSTPTYQAAPPSVVQAVTGIPSSVYNAVGTTSPAASVTPPDVLHGQPALRDTGKPEVLFIGNEFCPYCAAERWALVAALSRFGKFSGLDTMESGSNEAFAGTPTFTFVGTHYTSRYIRAVLVEHYGLQKNGAGTAYSVLQPLTSQERTLWEKYGNPTGGGSGPLVPFVDVAGKGVAAGGSFSPSVLQQLSADQIATGLSDEKDPSTQAIAASANYLSALICTADGQQPTSVCTSTGVALAAAALAHGA